MKTLINGTEYDLLIEGDDIIAQGLKSDLIFNGGYAELSGMAIEVFNGHHGRNYPSIMFLNRSEFISEYVEQEIETYCKSNFENAEVIEHNLN